MRSIWNGSLAFGLVNIPVHLYSGSQKHSGLDLDMLSKKDHSPINFIRVSSKTGEEVPYEEIIKAAKVSDGHYVEVTEEDFKNADVKKTHTIEIKQFCNEDEIDSRFYDKPYILEPEKGAEKAYALLRESLEKSGKVALATFVLRNRENIAAIKPVGRSLILNQLRYLHDLREPGSLNIPSKSGASDEEIKMATAIINKSTKHFIPEDWHDTYTEKLEKAIDAKKKGQKIAGSKEKPEASDVKDLMKLLKASLDK